MLAYEGGKQVNYYEAEEALKKRGIDYDLSACLEYNSPDLTIDDIEMVLAVWEGEKDEDDWRWIIRKTDGSVILLVGGCDYTGWDCRSGAQSFPAASVTDALYQVATEDFSYANDRHREVIIQHMKDQLDAGVKATTWREEKDEELQPAKFIWLA